MHSLSAKLRKGPPLLGISCMIPSAAVVDRIASDWDFLWFDAQHGQHDYRSLIECVRAADFWGIESLVRVPANDRGWIMRALDMGASGVIVPQVDTAEQARAAAHAAKFAPVGGRSFGGRRVGDLQGRGYAHSANEDTVLVVQAESKRSIDNIAEIAACNGVDACFFGPDDMALDDGQRMDEPRDYGRFVPALEAVAAAATGNGKQCGGVFSTADALAQAVRLGFRLISVGGDQGFLAAQSGNVAGEMRASLEREGAAAAAAAP